MEDVAAVQKKIEILNAENNGTWIPGIGFHSLMAFEFGTTNNNPNFKNNEGYSVKIFINTSTGEVRSFAASLFYVGNDKNG